MADDKTKQDGRDDNHIDAHDTSEVEYEAKKLGVEPQQIRDAIAAVGSSRAKVEAWIKNS